MISIASFTFNPFQENTYVLFDETKECIIIDPGCYTEAERSELVDFIEKNDLKPVKLINTHCHIDHVFGNRFIAEKYKLGLSMNEKDLPILHSLERTGHLYSLNVELSPEPTELLDEGDKVSFGTSELEILFTPGHSPGSICLYNKIQKFVIAGDVLFAGSIGRSDFPGGDHDTLISSIKEKVLALGDDFTVYPGHGPETNTGREKISNPFLV